VLHLHNGRIINVGLHRSLHPNPSRVGLPFTTKLLDSAMPAINSVAPRLTEFIVFRLF